TYFQEQREEQAQTGSLMSVHPRKPEKSLSATLFGFSYGPPILFAIPTSCSYKPQTPFAPAQSGQPLPADTFALSGQEPRKEPLHPLITIDGYAVRAGKYQKDAQTGKRTYSLTLAHHPDPDNRKEVIYYDLVAEDEKAD